MIRFQKAIVLGIVVGVLGVILRPTGVGLRLEEDLGLRWLFALRGPLSPRQTSSSSPSTRVPLSSLAWTHESGRLRATYTPV
jgi:hypothetical protein